MPVGYDYIIILSCASLVVQLRSLKLTTSYLTEFPCNVRDRLK